MPDLNFSYGFTKYVLKNGRTVQRPMIPARLTAPSGKQVDASFLVDSGADTSVIPRSIAETLLGLNVGSLPVEDTNSVSGSMQVGVVELQVTLEQAGRKESFNARFQVPLNCPGFPSIPLLGRDPLFDVFDINFRGGYTTALGKFVLRRITKQRDPAGYNVGGKPIVEKRKPRRS